MSSSPLIAVLVESLPRFLMAPFDVAWAGAKDKHSALIGRVQTPSAKERTLGRGERHVWLERGGGRRYVVRDHLCMYMHFLSSLLINNNALTRLLPSGSALLSANLGGGDSSPLASAHKKRGGRVAGMVCCRGEIRGRVLLRRLDSPLRIRPYCPPQFSARLETPLRSVAQQFNKTLSSSPPAFAHQRREGRVNGMVCWGNRRISFNGAIPTPKPTCNTTIILLDHVVPLLFGFQLYQLTTSTKQIFYLPIL